MFAANLNLHNVSMKLFLLFCHSNTSRYIPTHLDFKKNDVTLFQFNHCAINDLNCSLIIWKIKFVLVPEKKCIKNSQLSVNDCYSVCCYIFRKALFWKLFSGFLSQNNFYENKRKNEFIALNYQSMSCSQK